VSRSQRNHRDRYPDLAAGFGLNIHRLIQHYRDHGKREGRDFECSPDVEAVNEDQASQAVCYAYRYPDLLNGFGCDAQALEGHFARAGEAEGRLYGCELDLTQASRSSDAICYANSYADLKAAFGYDARQLETHFQVHPSIPF
jgi:hypothetical protein